MEQVDKFNNALSQIKYQGNPGLHTILYKNWNRYHNFAPLKLSSSIRYEWVLILTKKYPFIISTTSDIHRTDKHEHMTQFTPQFLRQLHIQVTQQ